MYIYDIAHSSVTRVTDVKLFITNFAIDHLNVLCTIFMWHQFFCSRKTFPFLFFLRRLYAIYFRVRHFYRIDIEVMVRGWIESFDLQANWSQLSAGFGNWKQCGPQTVLEQLAGDFIRTMVVNQQPHHKWTAACCAARGYLPVVLLFTIYKLPTAGQ